ncbi:hypothetical protein H6G79_15285 [Anabaena sp. FACHB-83]|nr:hypothetical protein [Anabaena sp. FACHB-83]
MQAKQLFIHCLICFSTTVALSADLTNYHANAQSQNLSELKTGENSNNIIQAQNIRFHLQKCQRTGQSKTVSCHLLFTATSEREQRITIFGDNESASSRAFDLAGNEYSASFAQVGKFKSTDIYNGEVRNELIPDVPIKAIINFELPTDVNQLAAFVVKYNLGEKAVFRDIKIVTVKPQAPSNRKK